MIDATLCRDIGRLYGDLSIALGIIIGLGISAFVAMLFHRN